MLKCPHCKGLLDLNLSKGGRQHLEPYRARQRITLLQWSSDPVTLGDLLIGMGSDKNLTPFEPLDRLVVRTAFRVVDAVRELGDHFRPNSLYRDLPGWSKATEPRRMMGVLGRFMIREGCENTPGFLSVEEFERGDYLI